MPKNELPHDDVENPEEPEAGRGRSLLEEEEGFSAQYSVVRVE